MISAFLGNGYHCNGCLLGRKKLRYSELGVPRISFVLTRTIGERAEPAKIEPARASGKFRFTRNYYKPANKMRMRRSI